MNLAEFAGLSEVLTGFDSSKILPEHDTHNMAQEYLDILNKPGLVPGNGVQLLTTTWNAIVANTGTPVTQQVQDKIMNDPTLGPLAKNIIYMWYVGTWYDMYQKPNNDFVVSSKAYINGLVWESMGAHPMGYSEGVFGYWNSPPTMPTL